MVLLFADGGEPPQTLVRMDGPATQSVELGKFTFAVESSAYVSLPAAGGVHGGQGLSVCDGSPFATHSVIAVVTPATHES